MDNLLASTDNHDNEEENFCPICYNILQNHTTSIFLPCNHSLCLHCFANCILQDIYKCPICRDPKLQHILANYTQILISDFLPLQNLTQNEKQLGNILTICIAYANRELFDYLLTTYDVNITEFTDEDGNTCIHTLLSSLSSSEKKLQFLKFLIEEKNVNTQVTNDHGETLIHHAVHFGEPEIAKYLLENNFANANQQDNFLSTPLIHLIASKFYETQEKN